MWRWHDWSTFIEQINDSIYVLYYYIKVQEKCEYTKWVIRSRYSQDRQYRGKMRKNRTTNNDLQTTDDIAKQTRRFSVMERRKKRDLSQLWYIILDLKLLEIYMEKTTIFLVGIGQYHSCFSIAIVCTKWEITNYLNRHDITEILLKVACCCY